ncbi:MAG: proprotein convertase P-domain-containing protein [Candidatus Hydrogenedentes bacterium]|nr:proprotein convertase P-domain-containing protein [Candidatus Hydrogenedentota bacterium]
MSLRGMNALTQWQAAVDGCMRMRYLVWTLVVTAGLCPIAGAAIYSSSTTPIAIADNDSTGVTKTISVPDSVSISDINVAVHITHPNISNLIVRLRSPVGTEVTLHDGINVGTVSVIALYDDDCGTAPDGPGTLADYSGQNTSGTWTLSVSDNALNDTGTLDDWQLIVNSPPTGEGITGHFNPVANQEAGRTVTVFNPFTTPMTQVAIVSAEPLGDYCVEVPAGVYWIQAATFSLDCGKFYKEARLTVVVSGQKTTEDFVFNATKASCGGGNILPPAVVGTVLDSVSGLPIPNAAVSLDSGAAAPTVSGTYFFTLASVGGHTVQASATGYINGSAQSVSGGTTQPEIVDLFLDPAPPPPVVNSIVRADANPTNAATAQFAVTFSVAVTGVTNDDFALTPSGISGASVTGISGTGASRTVTVNTGSGTGMLRLDVNDNDSIVDAIFSTPLGGAGLGNGNFTTGEIYTIDRTPPDVAISSAAPDPTVTSPIPVTVSFTEPVTGFDATDIIVSNASVANFAGSNADYSFDLIPAAAGLVTADIAAGAALDSVGNANTAASQFARTFSTGDPSDIDHDGAINAVDVQLVINAALGLDIGARNADINSDTTINAVDVQLVINAALAK